MALYTTDKSMPWNLDLIRFLYPPDDFLGSFNNEKMQARHKAMQDEKIKQILTNLENAENPIEAMRALHKLDHLQFLQNNVPGFKQADCFEEAVILLYHRKNGPFTPTDNYPIWEEMLNACSPERMEKVGSPFPATTMTAYRGSVTGRAKGLSWTVSQKKANWFLDRWKDKDMGGGTIFSLEISKEDVLYYTEGEDRHEVILFPYVLENANIKTVKDA